MTKRRDFVPISRIMIRALRSAKLTAATRWTLLELAVEADGNTGEVKGSWRWLASRLGVSRRILIDHLRQLEAAGLVELSPGVNHHAESRLKIIPWGILTALTGPPTGSPTGPPSGPLSRPVDPLSPAALPPLELQELQDPLEEAAEERQLSTPNDIQNYCLGQLQEHHSNWRTITSPTLARLNAKFGRPVVTSALQRMWEEKAVPKKSAYGLLQEVCRDVEAVGRVS